MKKNLIIAAAVLTLFGACDTTIDVNTVSTAPSVVFSDIAINAGEAEDITLTIKDGSITPLKSAQIWIATSGKDSTVLFSTETTLSGQKTEIVLDADETEISTYNPGSYKLWVKALDSDNQEIQTSKSFSLACAPVASCVVAGKTTVILIAPTTTPADAKIGLVGTLTKWGGDPDIILTKISTNCYCAAVNFDDGDGDGKSNFKFRRSQNAGTNPDWPYVEKTASCGELSDRVQAAAPDKTLTFTVANWRNTGTCPD